MVVGHLSIGNAESGAVAQTEDIIDNVYPVSMGVGEGASSHARPHHSLWSILCRGRHRALTCEDREGGGGSAKGF